MDMLKKLSAKKRMTILGINSGTSADGIDLALIRFDRTGRAPRISYLDGAMRPYPAKIKTELERFIGDEDKNTEDLARMDIAFGRLLGRTAAEFISDGKRRVDLIASHGQTVGHFPAKRKNFGYKTGTTIQIGDGNAVAAETSLPVISDFRRADVALGGEGAPLTPFVNHLLFGDRKKSRIVVNIGGIANYSYHPAGKAAKAVRGGDCGPGNILSDMVCRLLFKRKYDRDGAIARKGEISEKIITLIERANKRRRISAGREQFDRDLLARIVHSAGGPIADRAGIVASIMEATARLIHQSLKPFLQDDRLAGVYLTGGGRKNLFLVERVQEKVSPHRVWPIESLGYDGDLLEAVSFAVLGGCFVTGIASTLPGITGSAAGGIAGKLSLPPLTR